MLLPIVTNTVSMRLADESISVREAAVALVGNYIDKSPHAIQNYQAALIPCLTDSGVSVRKRAVKIFESILVKNPHFRGSSEICNVLLQRSSDPKEEDGVRDLIDETFCKLWLRDGTESISQHTAKRRLSFESAAQIPSIPGVVTPNSPEVVTKRRQSHVRSDFASEQMMEVVRTAGSGADLEALLKKLLNGTINSDSERKQTERQKRQALGQAQCNQLVESLFALLVVIDEQRNIRNDVGKDLAATLTTIGVFANVSPHPILKHLDTITLYLKADNGVSKEDESSIVCATCDIMFRLIPAFDKQVISRLTDGSLAQDLTKVTYKFGPSALAPTIRAFSALANKADSMGNSLLGKRLLVVVRTFYAYAANKNSYDDFSVAAVSSI